MLIQGTVAGSISASLTSATYAALQVESNNCGGCGSNSSIGALLSRVREFPDMLTEDVRRMRLERCEQQSHFLMMLNVEINLIQKCAG
jgi:hypothetical protein